MSDTNTGQVVLITGASSGIGQAAARRLTAAGYRVFGTSRRPTAATVDGYAMLPLDVTSDESVETCVRTVLERTGGRIDMLLSNVGTGILGAAEESSAAQVRDLFEANFFGAVRVVNAVLPAMRARKAGRVLVMSSSGGIASIPYAGYYCATKHALEAYVEALRLEVEPFGIAASVVAPGPVSTPAGRKAMNPDRPNAAYAPASQQAAENFTRAIENGMDPGKVAEAVLAALRAGWPAPRILVGGSSRATSLLKRLLPARLFEAGVRRAVRP